MKRMRVIPTLLLDRNGGLVKSVRFGKRTYIGDPINAVRIFNEKEVDELILLDIDATVDSKGPNYAVIEDIVSEAFMPVAFGGGICSVEQMATILRSGVEKVVLNAAPHGNPSLIGEAVARFGRQSVVGGIDVKKSLFGKYSVFTHSGKRNLGKSPTEIAMQLERSGVGELMVYSIDRDGTRVGYDIPLLQGVASGVGVPVIACGGAGTLDDFIEAHEVAGCSAVAAGSMFVYQSSTQGVLINYPTRDQLDDHVFSRLQCNLESRTL